MFLPPQLFLILSWIRSFILDWWWLIGPPFFILISLDLWLRFVRWRYFLGLKWIILEVKLPQIVERTPQAMEQVFAGLHGLYSRAKPHEKYLKGKVPAWGSCELVSINGESHFLIRVPEVMRHLVESHVWAQYPDAEIIEADDYLASMPPILPDSNYEMWGTELGLAKPDPYPIKTYPEFESPVEERRLDPLSPFLEVLSSLGPGEQAWLQILFEPTFDGWQQRGKEIVNKMVGKVSAKKKTVVERVIDGALSELGHVLNEMVGVLFGTPPAPTAPEEAAKQQAPISFMMLSPIEREVAEAIEKNTSKLPFRVNMRMVYVAKREAFNGSRISSLFGGLRQFSAQHLNGFMPNLKTMPNVTYILPKQRNHLRKRRLYWRYRLRRYFKKSFLFNTEEMATIFHFPGAMVAKAPAVTRIEAKKGEPPSSLPIA